MGDGLRVVLEVADKAVREILPTLETTTQMRLEDEFEQVYFLSVLLTRNLFLRLKQTYRGLVP